MLALVIAQTVAIVLLGLLVAGLLRSHAEILRALERLGVNLDPDREENHTFDYRVPDGVQSPGSGNAAAHDLSGLTPDDEATVIRVAGARERILVAFLSSTCKTCAGFWDAFARGDRLGLPDDVRLVVVAHSPSDEDVGRIRERAPDGVTVLLSNEAWMDYEVPGAPYFVLVDGPSARVLGEGSAATPEQVADLLRRALQDTDAAAGGRAAAVGHARRGDERMARDDAELLAAGIHPGHPSLYPEDASAVEEDR